MKLTNYLLVLLMPLIMSNSTHEFYVSVTKIEYIEAEKSVQIISRIFIDDFEKLLRERYDDTIVLDTDDEPSQVDVYTERYLSQRINIKINGEEVKFEFLGKEYEDDIIFCYMEIPNIDKVKSFEITNKVLFDLFEEQQNIVRTKFYSKNKSFILIPPNDKGVLNFD